MATYNDNILPRFNTSWTLQDCSTSGTSLIMNTVGGYAEYIWAQADYHIGKTAKLVCSMASGVYYVYISYTDTETSESYVHTTRVTTGYKTVVIELASAVINSLVVRIVCDTTGTIYSTTLQLQSDSNASSGGGGGGGTVSGSNARTFTSRFLATRPNFDNTSVKDFSTPGVNSLVWASIGNGRSHEMCIAQLVVGLDSALIYNNTAEVSIQAAACMYLGLSSSSFQSDTSYYTEDKIALIRLYFGDVLLAETVHRFNFTQYNAAISVPIAARLSGEALENRDKTQKIPLRLCVKFEALNADDTNPRLWFTVNAERSYITATGPIILREVYGLGLAQRHYWSWSETTIPNFAVAYSNDKPTVLYFMMSGKYNYEKVALWSLPLESSLGVSDINNAIVTPNLISSYNTSWYDRLCVTLITDIRRPIPYKISGDSAAVKIDTSEKYYYIGMSNSSNGGELLVRNSSNTFLFDIDTGVTAFDVCQQGIWYDPTDMSGMRIFGFTIVYAKENKLYAACYPKYNSLNASLSTEITSLDQFDIFEISHPSITGTIKGVTISALQLWDRAPIRIESTGDWGYSFIFGISLLSHDYSSSSGHSYTMQGTLHFDSYYNHSSMAKSQGKFYTSNFSPHNPGTGQYYTNGIKRADWVDYSSGAVDYVYDRNVDQTASLDTVPYLHKEYIAQYTERSYAGITPLGETSEIHTNIPAYLSKVLTTYCGDRHYFTNFNQFFYEQISDYDGDGYVDPNETKGVYIYYYPIYGNLYMPTILDTYRFYPHMHISTGSTASNTHGKYAVSRCGAWPTKYQTTILYDMLPSGTIGALQVRSRVNADTSEGHYAIYFTDAMMPEVHLNLTQNTSISFSQELVADDLVWYQPKNLEVLSTTDTPATSAGQDSGLYDCSIRMYTPNYPSSGTYGGKTLKSPHGIFLLQLQREGISRPTGSSSGYSSYGDLRRNIPKDWMYIQCEADITSVNFTLFQGTLRYVSSGSTSLQTKDLYTVWASPKHDLLTFSTSQYFYGRGRKKAKNDFVYYGWGPMSMSIGTLNLWNDSYITP